jgi:hypothetical protein
VARAELGEPHAAREPKLGPANVGDRREGGSGAAVHQSLGGTQTGSPQHEPTAQSETPSEQVPSGLHAAKLAHAVLPWTQRVPNDVVPAQTQSPPAPHVLKLSQLPGVLQMNCATGLDAAAALLSMLVRTGAVHAMAVPAVTALSVVRLEIVLGRCTSSSGIWASPSLIGLLPRTREVGQYVTNSKNPPSPGVENAGAGSAARTQPSSLSAGGCVACPQE